MKNVLFAVTLFSVIVLNVQFSLDLTEMFAYSWALVNSRWV